MYCTQEDMEQIFGQRNIEVWSNLENESGATDTIRVQSAIAYAAAYIEQRFRGGVYQLPIVTINSSGQRLLKDMAARAAAWWLRQSRVSGVEGEALSQDPILENTIQAIQTGQMQVSWQVINRANGPSCID